MKYHIYTDGASRKNPGKSASGYFIYDENHKLVKRCIFYNGICTNNVAEYKAIVSALKSAIEEFGTKSEVELYCDSKLVINQISGAYKVKDAGLKVLNREARSLLKNFEDYRLINVRRENGHIQMVDKELNLFLDMYNQ